MNSLFGRSLYENRWFIVGWSLVFLCVSALVMTFFPTFSEGTGIGAVAKNLPDQLKGLIGNAADYQTIDGFVALQVYDVRMTLLLMIMTLVLAIRMTLSVEESGDLRTILAIALARSRYLIQRWFAAIVVVGIVCLISVAGIYIGLSSLGETASHALIWQLFGLSWLFGVTAFTIPFAVALATGKKLVVMGISLTVILASYLLATFGRTVEWLRDWEWLSLQHYFDTSGLRHQSFEVINVAVLICIIGALLTVGYLGFKNRDVS